MQLELFGWEEDVEKAGMTGASCNLGTIFEEELMLAERSGVRHEKSSSPLS